MICRDSVVILGAGASTPFYGNHSSRITTTSLVEAVLKSENWNRQISKFVQFYQSNNLGALINFDVDEILDLVGSLKKKINTEFGYVTFDQIIHLLEPITISLSNRGFGGSSENLNELFFDVSTFSYSSTSIDAWRYVPYLIREVIAFEINRCFNSKNNKKHVYLKRLRKWHQENLSRMSLQIYSFNYDMLLAESVRGLGIESGFRNNSFDGEAYWHSKSSYSQLHGRIDAYADDENYILARNPRIAQRNRLANASSSDVRSIFRISANGSLGKHYNTWLVSGMEKIETFSTRPFSTFFQKLALDITRTDVIVIIGSSLGDIHINSFIVNAVEISKKKIVLVTKLRIDDFLSNFQMLSFNNQDFLVNLMVRMGFTVSSVGNTVVQGVQNFKNRVWTEYNKGGFFYLNNRVAIVPDGSKFFYENAVLMRRIFPRT
jgi:hypothetical protein